MQHTQQPTAGTARYSWELENVDGTSDSILLSKGTILQPEIYQDRVHGWLVSNSALSYGTPTGIMKLGIPLYDVLDFMEHKGIDIARFKAGVHYVSVADAELYNDILWTPTGLKELAKVLPILGCTPEDAMALAIWVNMFQFFGDYAKETIIKKREELIKSNAEGYMMDSYQLSKTLGIRPDSIRTTKCRHTDKLIEGLHWKYSTRGNRTLLFTKLGCLVMSSLVGTEEAQRTRGFLELAFGITLEELTRAA